MVPSVSIQVAKPTSKPSFFRDMSAAFG